MVGANLLTYRQTQAANFLRPAIGGWIVTEKLLLFSLTVVSAVFGGCQTTTGGTPSSTGFEPGADEAADPSASTLLLFAAELATTLLLAALGFYSQWLIVLLDHVKRDVSMWCAPGCSLATSPHAHANGFVRKRNLCEPQSFLRICTCLLYTSPSPRD